jgi:hypothetical protein
MSDLRNHPPVELLDMFERRQGDIGPVAPMPPSIRRRIRTHRTVTAAALVALSVLLIGVAVRTLPSAFDPRPANPTPPAPGLRPTASGHTELFRWRVLAGPVVDGRIEAQLQTSSLSGGDWYTVRERRFDVTADAFWDTYQLMGPTPQQGAVSSVVWGFVPDGANSVVVESGCDPITISADAFVPAPGGGVGLWGGKTACSGPGSVAALRSDGSELIPPTPYNLTPTDLWAIATAKADGVGWIIHRILDQPTGVAAGDAGIPDDLRWPIRGDDLNPANVAWREAPQGGDLPFVYGLAVIDADRVMVVLEDGRVTPADMTELPGDDFRIFWVQPGSSAPATLVAFDAACNVLANESLSGAPAADPPADACTPDG